MDIMAWDPQLSELVVVEVKTRSSSAFGDPSLAVSRGKIRSMHAVALAYCAEQHIDSDYRFDIIAITPGGIEHYPNVAW